jgi:hypothetical protein
MKNHREVSLTSVVWPLPQRSSIQRETKIFFACVSSLSRLRGENHAFIWCKKNKDFAESSGSSS